MVCIIASIDLRSTDPSRSGVWTTDGTDITTLTLRRGRRCGPASGGTGGTKSSEGGNHGRRLVELKHVIDITSAGRVDVVTVWGPPFLLSVHVPRLTTVLPGDLGECKSFKLEYYTGVAADSGPQLLPSRQEQDVFRHVFHAQPRSSRVHGHGLWLSVLSASEITGIGHLQVDRGLAGCGRCQPVTVDGKTSDAALAHARLLFPQLRLLCIGSECEQLAQPRIEPPPG